MSIAHGTTVRKDNPLRQNNET
eukprot:SAG31_NODE_33771_length_340_cov_0.804979_1_plen_21_part_10